MGFWSKKEPDAIDRICESIRTKWWEWSVDNPQFSNMPDTVLYGIKHLNGIRLCFSGPAGVTWGMGPKSRHRASIIAVGGSGWALLTPAESDRLWFAYQDWFAAKATAKKTDYGPTAKALAQAVLDGHTDAVNGLMDLLLENGHDRN